MKTHCVLPLVLVLVSLTASACTAQTTPLTLKLEVAQGLPVLDGVYVNGRGPYRFLLDTGNQSNEMDPDLARELGVAAAFQLELETPAGVTTVPGARADSVAAGPEGAVKAAGQEFLITRNEALRRLGAGIRGTLGQQFLAHFDYTLDLARHRMEIAGEPPEGQRVPFRRVAGCVVIATSEGALMLDSGSNVLFLFRASPRLENAMVTTSNADMGVAVGRAPALRIGGRRYEMQDATFRAVPGAPVDGLLPVSAFRSVYVSNSGRYVVFDGR